MQILSRFSARTAIAAVVLALTLMTFVGVSSDVSAQTATATRTATAAGAAPAAAKTGNAGLVQNEGSGVMLPAALAVGTVVLLASGWYVAGKRRA